jgi:hypothetical protein
MSIEKFAIRMALREIHALKKAAKQAVLFVRS